MDFLQVNCRNGVLLDHPQLDAFLGKTASDSIYHLFATNFLEQPLRQVISTERVVDMLQDPVNQDMFATHRPSPWPYVGAILCAVALVTTLMMAFSG
ncbi:hypothetical protein [Labrenzia sp. PHM005]|uniref:hypothetical protein n=1 Tax=Labrenzia sp. PHM005 TaxID=2590016 RepID=UPI0011405EE7|nr:hypothetical protein [Labrenzia sp. PHM005]QDG76523.1 hypothetical protein FJ695_11935 [Labrenzia sp. PHM005]